VFTGKAGLLFHLIGVVVLDGRAGDQLEAAAATLEPNLERVGRSRHRRCDPGRAHRLLHPHLLQFLIRRPNAGTIDFFYYTGVLYRQDFVPSWVSIPWTRSSDCGISNRRSSRM
jgi:hypothetical protein